MTEKQEIRYRELKSALEQLADDVYKYHWKDLDQETKDRLMEKFEACLVRLETALASGKTANDADNAA